MNENKWVLSVLVISMLVSGGAAMAQGDVKVEQLRCEYLENPLGIDADEPRLGWVLTSGQRGTQQTAYQVLVASTPEILASDQGDLWDSGKVTSDESAHVVYAGKPLTSRTACYWKVRVWTAGDAPSAWSAPASWTMGLLNATDWQGEWIGCDWMEDNTGRLPWLRKTIDLDAAPERAMAYVSALGYYELYINGRKVDDYVLTPPVTDYGKRALYLTHDVSDYLVKGKNCIALWLGRGWTTLLLKDVAPNGPVAKAQVEIALPGGATTVVATDGSWKTEPSCISPIGQGKSGDYGGEAYDAREETADWNAVSFDDAAWKPATVYHPATPLMSALMVQPNRIFGTFDAVSVTEKGSGYLIDMGKNYTGWFALALPDETPAGTEVHIEYADKQFEDGKLQTYHQRDDYIAKGGGNESFCSRFNYHAFRWAYVTGLPRKPELKEAKGQWICTGYKPAADFKCSNDLLNRIYDTTVWTYRCLTINGYVVDCPHRERLGYGGDSGTSMETGMMNYALAPFFTKWARDWRDAQGPDGDLPHTAPHPHGAGGGPAWGGFCVTMPWQVYVQYGDKRILEQAFPTMERWLAFLDTKTKDGFLEHYVGMGCEAPQWNFLGDWVPPGRDQGANRVDDLSTLFFNNAYYLYNLQLASKAAAVLGKEAEAKAYAAKAETLSKAIHKRFLNDDGGTYVNREQTYLAMPLLFGITPEDLQPTVMKNLENDILVGQKGHLNTGMHGTYFMFKYFMDQNRNDLIYTIATQETYPGWGFMLDQGATTIWEEWNGNNSQIHDTLISVGAWFLQGIGGIRVDESQPGFKHFAIKPGVETGLESAKAEYESLYGPIVSEWTQKDGAFTLNLTVPINATATVYIPAASADAVSESGKALAEAGGVSGVRYEDGKAICEVGSGTYRFEAK